MSLVRFPAIFITLVVLSGCAVAQERESSKDIPSIAREALKSVVIVETKDGLGNPYWEFETGFIDCFRRAHPCSVPTTSKITLPLTAK
jgi:hypothetical protein